jgi:hypothetical protein
MSAVEPIANAQKDCQCDKCEHEGLFVVVVVVVVTLATGVPRGLLVATAALDGHTTIASAPE